ncbi:MAG TPA: hypothetical protein PKA63_12990 [Oligoflexia bacterium]|nr:hypothetical protein [Oligoflexia bacterium]HMP49575.1 hypothetical protein [Oligoflexia bacterium]
MLWFIAFLLFRFFGISLQWLSPKEAEKRFLKYFLEDEGFLRLFSERLLKSMSIERADIMPLIREYARYMALKVSAKDCFEVPSELVDEVWHTHLLFNHHYERTCVRAFGFVVFHVPGDKEMEVGKYETKFNETRLRYLGNFGTPPEKFWGIIPKELIPKASPKNLGRKSLASSSSGSDDGTSMIAASVLLTTSSDSPSSSSGCASSWCGGSSGSSSSSCGGASSCGGGSGCGGGGCGG